MFHRKHGWLYRLYKPGTCSKDLPVLDSKEVQSIAPPSCPDDCNHRGRWVAVGGSVLMEFAMLGAAVITCFWLRIWLVEDWLYQFSHSDLQPSERKAVNFEIAIVLTCRSSQHRPTILDTLKLTLWPGQMFQTFTRQFVPYVWLGVLLINVTGVLMHQHDGHQRIRQDLQCRNSPLTDPQQQETDRSRFGDHVKKSFCQLSDIYGQNFLSASCHASLGRQVRIRWHLQLCHKLHRSCLWKPLPKRLQWKGSMHWRQGLCFPPLFRWDMASSDGWGPVTWDKRFPITLQTQQSPQVLGCVSGSKLIWCFQCKCFQLFSVLDTVWASVSMQIWLPKESKECLVVRQVKEMSKRHSALDYEVPECITWQQDII